MKIISIEDDLYETTNPIFRKKKKKKRNYFDMSSAENVTCTQSVTF